jgi:hypothetical protein
MCQICATLTFGETGNQRVMSGLRMRQASQVDGERCRRPGVGYVLGRCLDHHQRTRPVSRCTKFDLE